MNRKEYYAHIITLVLFFVLVPGGLWLQNYHKSQGEKIKELIVQKEELEGDIKWLKRELELQEDKHQEEMNKLKPRRWKGMASWYGDVDEECEGCREDRRMSNGRVFDETKNTIAFNWLSLNSIVRVTNLSNGLSEIVTVTDTGGFNGLGRIADLSKGVKNKLECEDLCHVQVEEIL